MSRSSWKRSVVKEVDTDDRHISLPFCDSLLILLSASSPAKKDGKTMMTLSRTHGDKFNYFFSDSLEQILHGKI